MAALGRVEEIVSDVRYEKDVVGTWYRDRLTVRLKEAGASGAGAEPEGTGTTG
jgi:hypothetical protein